MQCCWRCLRPAHRPCNDQLLNNPRAYQNENLWSGIEKWFRYNYLSTHIFRTAILWHDAHEWSFKMTIFCSIPRSSSNNQDWLGDVGKESDGGPETTKIIPMPITTANEDRKQPTANQTIFWSCRTEKQSPTAVSVAHCMFPAARKDTQKTEQFCISLVKQNSVAEKYFAFHQSENTVWRKLLREKHETKAACDIVGRTGVGL